MGKDKRELSEVISKTFLGGWDISLSKYSIVKGNRRVYSVSLYFTGLIFDNVVKLNELFTSLENEGFSTSIINGNLASFTYTLKDKNKRGGDSKPSELEKVILNFSMEETSGENGNSYTRITLSYETPLNEYLPHLLDGETIVEWEKRKESEDNIVHKAVMSILSSIEKYIKT